MTGNLLTLLLWSLSTAISFAGAWLFKFTREDPGRPGRLLLTTAGKWALPIASLAFLIGFVSQMVDQRHAQATARENHDLHQEVVEVRDLARQMSTKLADLIAASPATQQAIARNINASNDVKSVFEVAAIIDPSLQELRDKTQRLITGQQRTTPLEADVNAKNPSAVEATLNSGANPDASGDLGIPPLALAASNGDIKSVQTLLSHGANVNKRSAAALRTPLFSAQSIEMAALLLRHSADLDAVDGVGETPLLLATITPNHDLIQFYVHQGANVNVANSRGDTPLKRVAVEGSSKDVAVLLEGGADPNFAPGPDHMTALNSLMMLNPCPKEDRLSSLSLLIDHGARCDLTDPWGSPLKRATSNHCQRFEEVLSACIHNTR